MSNNKNPKLIVLILCLTSAHVSAHECGGWFGEVSGLYAVANDAFLYDRETGTHKEQGRDFGYLEGGFQTDDGFIFSLWHKSLFSHRDKGATGFKFGFRFKE